MDDKNKSGEYKVNVDGGVVEVLNNKTTVLVEGAVEM